MTPARILAAGLLLLHTPLFAAAQRAPEAGYILPAGGKAGATVKVQIGGYNWTPDLEYKVSDPRIRLIPAGPPSPLLIPGPPYWFGAKGRLASLPIPRETSAQLIIPADIPPGPIFWHVANANGISSPVAFMITAAEDSLEDESQGPLQNLATLPAAVSGRLLRNEEIDRYTFIAPMDGPITCDLQARRLGSKFLPIVEIRDDKGNFVADVAGSHQDDPILTFAAKANVKYTLSIRDLDFAGDRSFVYRLRVARGPRIVAARPAAGQHGATSPVEFLLAMGDSKTATIKRTITFPKSGSQWSYAVETPQGNTLPFSFALSPHAQTEGNPSTLALPIGVTGTLEQFDAEHRYVVAWMKGEVWSLSLAARRFGSPLDVALAIHGPPDKDGKRKEVARNEDLPDATDAGLEYAVPADGEYEILVSDTAGKSGSPLAVYHLDIHKPEPDFTLKLTAPKWTIPLGGKADVPVKATRRGGFKSPIALTLHGLPEGVTAPADLVIPADKSDLTITLKAPDDAGTSASVARLEGTATINDVAVKRTALAPVTAQLITRHPDDNQSPAFVVATTMKQRFKGRPVDQDTGRKVPRGSTHLAEILIDRLDGFDGEITLQMAATQSYQHQGITGEDIVVPPGVSKTLYPCFMPEWLESTRTSRMGIIAVAKVADPRGKVRYLVSDIAGFVTMTMEGSLLKISCDDGERTLPSGAPFDVVLKVARLSKLVEPVQLELIAPKDLAGQIKAEAVAVAVGQDKATVRVTPAATLTGMQTFIVRATALQDGKYRVVSETPVTVEFGPTVSSRTAP